MGLDRIQITLDRDQKKQLHQAFVSTFRSTGALKRLSSFGLGIGLDEIITGNQNTSDAALELIEWAEANGLLTDLINEAKKRSPKSPTLLSFLEQVWEPLAPQPTSSQITTAQLQTPLSTGELTQIQPLPVIAINKRRNRSKKNTGNGSKGVTSTPEATTDISPLPFPEVNMAQQRLQTSENRIRLAQNHADAARKALHTVIDIVQPEKTIYRDQCQFAVTKVHEANESIQKILDELVQVPSSSGSHLYLLDNEQTYFGDEARKVIVFFHELSVQTSELPLRKGIWDKLHLLLECLQELDDLIDAFGKHVDGN